MNAATEELFLQSIIEGGEYFDPELLLMCQVMTYSEFRCLSWLALRQTSCVVGNEIFSIYEAVLVRLEKHFCSHEKFVERTVDSSRYFVVRVVHPQTKKVAFIGFGFEERDDAFDFNCCLSDFKTRNDAPAEDPIIHAPSKDYSLKDGEKITV